MMIHKFYYVLCADYLPNSCSLSMFSVSLPHYVFSPSSSYSVLYSPIFPIVNDNLVFDFLPSYILCVSVVLVKGEGSM